MTMSRSSRFVALFSPIAVFSFPPIIIPTTHHHIKAPSTGTLSAAEISSDTLLFDRKPSKKDSRTDESSTSTSNLSLLEHVNFNVPNHDYILDFYLDILGCGLDPRVAVNLMDNDESFGREGLIWASCGPNQFHFPRDEQAQVLPGHIGLRYRSLDGLKERLVKASSSTDDDSSSVKGNKRHNNKCFDSYEVVVGPAGETIVQIQDRYGNVFHCREGPEKLTQYKQPVVKISDQDKFGDVALRYGVAEESDCRGIDYVEFDCGMETAEIIALFYESVFDATAVLRKDKNGQTVARIAFGDIDATTGRASQYLLFRETPSELPAYDGHHIAIYVGTRDTKDFERAFQKAQGAGLLSTNWRDKVDVLTLDAARSQNQFRIRSVLDVDTGLPIFQLEHEVRSVDHPTWPGVKQRSSSSS